MRPHTLRYTPQRVRRSRLLPAAFLLLASFPRLVIAQAQAPPRLEFGGYVQAQYANMTQDGSTLYRHREYYSALCRHHEVPPPADGGSFSNVAQASASKTDPHVVDVWAPLTVDAASLVWFDAECGQPVKPIVLFLLR